MALQVVFDNAAQVGDLVVTAGTGYVAEQGLRTYGELALFSWGRAHPGDPLRDKLDRKGWVGDALPEEQGFVYARSRLWLLHGEKLSLGLIKRAEEYSLEALAMLVELKVVEANEVEVAKASPTSVRIAWSAKRRGETAPRFVEAWNYELGHQ